ncbi:uncharacterized protein N7469_009514 [Penicillium citrinum]|uniref:BZIP domain-containing protein n=1 Tax=Penicillium citrinum TaxID=5077 RepID=A0A9W9NIN9_PENCI|nr:uncharacterized protein N7469_009514 [Penicillium citrinum]KAJ5220627.1 hypothetical protein N7469_009514 [Penicillium citrinum]
MPDPSPEAQIIPLDKMPQQAGVRDAKDDWTGVISRKERRKLQNRLNQRRYRLRKQHEDNRPAPKAETISGRSTMSSASIVELLLSFKHEKPEDFECAKAPWFALEFRKWFEMKAYESFMSGAPNKDHLISLSRLNVHRAINENIAAIGMTPAWMNSDDAISIFNIAQPSFSVESIPSCLKPTFIQLHIPHHPWLDFFPFPRMRDRMILAEDTFDDDDLCHDLMAFWDTRNTAATLLVWGNSWDAQNWEVTENFARKWKWLLPDSPELLASTNNWRRSRGERPLPWKDILSDLEVG